MGARSVSICEKCSGLREEFRIVRSVSVSEKYFGFVRSGRLSNWNVQGVFENVYPCILSFFLKLLKRSLFSKKSESADLFHIKVKL